MAIFRTRFKSKMALLLLNTVVLSMNCSTTKSKKTEVFTPEAILPAGADYTMSTNPYTGESGRARKGIIAATLNNVVLLNQLLTSKDSDEEQFGAIVLAVKDLIPSLQVVGIFDFFKIDEWLNTKDQPGRILVAVLYLQRNQERMTLELKKELQNIFHSTTSIRLKDAIRPLLK